MNVIRPDEAFGRVLAGCVRAGSARPPKSLEVRFRRVSLYPHTFHIVVPSKMERAKRDNMKGVGVYVAYKSPISHKHTFTEMADVRIDVTLK